MAKATAARGSGGGRERPPGGTGRGRPSAASPTPPSGRAGYAIEVYQELRKTTWPTGRELRRMTEVVVATVIMFGLIIGGLDFVLGLMVKPIYQQIGTVSTSTPAPTFTPVPKTTPTPAISTTPAASARASAAAASSSSSASTPTKTP